MIETLLFSSLGNKVYILKDGGLKHQIEVIISANKIHFFTAENMVIDFEIDLVDIDCCVLHRNNHELIALHLKSNMPDIILSLLNLRTNFLVGLMTSIEKSEFDRF